VLEVDPVENGQLRGRAMIGDDDGNIALQLARPPAEKQVPNAVQVLRAEESHPGPGRGGG